MRLPPLEPYGRCLMAYHLGDRDARLQVLHGLDGACELSAEIFFRQPEDFYDFEIVALSECRGRVLDVGAGSGLHSLSLQERGLSVKAIDIVPQAVEVMRSRGVRDVLEGDIFKLDLPSADTILLLMNGTGLAQTLDGLQRLLRRFRELVSEDGQLLIDSADPGPVTSGSHYAEARIELAYQDQWGEPYSELYCDYDVLARAARATGWKSQAIFSESDGTFLARLKLHA